jgi:hypothetical protein
VAAAAVEVEEEADEEEDEEDEAEEDEEEGRRRWSWIKQLKKIETNAVAPTISISISGVTLLDDRDRDASV